ncbi:OmpA family protein [Pedobacter sp. JY14-1]|uniref:OmpA family protein n=1 Tax=Pedobacter sp. JY14-1 TaxID=3034151 RepID=UPI0023E1C7F8|nr:OmpA family protein [Pedobacter sp. JY14-1]
MKRSTLLVLALLASLTFSCKTKKIAARPEPAPMEKPGGDDELDKIRKQMPNDEVERTENGIKFTFSSEVLFPTNSSYLSDAAKSKLVDVAKILSSKDPKRKIQIDGHTDATGTPEYNIWLSEKRAVSVKNFLVAQGIEESRIKTSGKGANQPVDTNKTPEGRLKNRRVEVTLLK